MSESMGPPPGERGETVATDMQSIVATAEMVNSSLDRIGFEPATPERPMVNFPRNIGDDGHRLLVQDVAGVGRTLRFHGPEEFSGPNPYTDMQVDLNFAPANDGWVFTGGDMNCGISGAFPNEYYTITPSDNGDIQVMPAEGTQRQVAEAVASYAKFVADVGQTYSTELPEAS